MPTRLEPATTVAPLSPEQLERLRSLLVDDLAVQEDRAIELQAPLDLERDLADVLLSRCYETIEEIEASLARMDLDAYGTCLSCASDIPFERLEVIPAADHCVVCQVERDRVYR